MMAFKLETEAGGSWVGRTELTTILGLTGEKETLRYKNFIDEDQIDRKVQYNSK